MNRLEFKDIKGDAYYYRYDNSSDDYNAIIYINKYKNMYRIVGSNSSSVDQHRVIRNIDYLLFCNYVNVPYMNTALYKLLHREEINEKG